MYGVNAWAIGVLLLAATVATLARSWPRSVPRVERRALMTRAELRFWRVLESAIPEARIMSQVAMGALLKPVAGLDPGARIATRNRFDRKVVDFVIVDPHHGSVLALVELDDASHAAKRPADRARDAMLARAGYTTLRVPTRPWPTVQAVRTAFEDASLVKRTGVSR